MLFISTQGMQEDQQLPHGPLASNVFLECSKPRVNFGYEWIFKFLLFWPCLAACGSLSDRRSNPHPLHWKHRVLTTELPRKPQERIFFDGCQFFRVPNSSPWSWDLQDPWAGLSHPPRWRTRGNLPAGGSATVTKLFCPGLVEPAPGSAGQPINQASSP